LNQQQQILHQQQQQQQQQLQPSVSPAAEDKDDKDKKKSKRKNAKADKASKESSVTSPSKDTITSSQQASSTSTPITNQSSTNVISASNQFDPFGFGTLDSGTGEKPHSINTSSSVDSNTLSGGVPLSAMFKGDLFSNSLSNSSLETPLEDPPADGLLKFVFLNFKRLTNVISL
jgi:hypothetical protein